MSFNLLYRYKYNNNYIKLFNNIYIYGEDGNI